MTNMEVPDDIVKAAKDIALWAEIHGHSEYEIHGICSRKRMLVVEAENAKMSDALGQINHVAISLNPNNSGTPLAEFVRNLAAENSELKATAKELGYAAELAIKQRNQAREELEAKEGK